MNNPVLAPPQDSLLTTSAKAPLVGRYDVIVVGGGMAGIAAALAARRGGMKTLLVESLPFIGGNATTGLPLSRFFATDSDRLVVAGIPRELCELMRAKGGFSADYEKNKWLPFDDNVFQLEVNRLLWEEGVELLCYSSLKEVRMEEGRIRHLIFSCKTEYLAYEASYVIDATGDAEVASAAGLEAPMGRARDGKTQPLTLVFTLGGIDQSKYSHPGIQKLWAEQKEKRNYRNPRAGSAISGATFIPGRPGEAYMNVTRMLVDKGTDPRALTAAEIEGRFQIEEFVEQFLKPHVPGFENCYITRIAHRAGVRETRRIVGEYTLTEEDLLQCRKFEDSVACNSYPIDVHSPDGGTTQYNKKTYKPGEFYTVPYRSLVAKGCDNLAAAGRCISATHQALGAVRVLTCSMATGEAAGEAAAIALEQGGQALRDVSIPDLRERLRKAGAIVE